MAVEAIRPIRAAHIIGTLTKEASGPTYSVVRLCETLIAAGDVVQLLSLDRETGGVERPFSRRFPLGRGPKRLGRSPAMRRWLSEQAAGGHLDVIHSHGLWMMINVYPGWVARRHGVPLIVSPRGTFTRYAMASGSRLKAVFWPLFQRPAVAGAVVFHATAEAEYEDIRRMGFRTPVAVIPNCIDLPDLTERRRGSRRTLLFLARVHPNKGVDLLLHAWRAIQARHSDWDLLIVGDDKSDDGTSGYLARMKALAQRLDVERVTFAGALYGTSKMQAYRDADLYVLPTHSENFGMTVAEALAQETPAIVTHGAPWAGLEARGAGWWVPLNVNSMSATLSAALSLSREKLDLMGKAGRRWMGQAFAWDNAAKEMRAVYGWTLGRSEAPPGCLRLD